MTLSTLVDLVKIQIVSTGSGIITLGSPVQGYRGIEALIDGRTYSYSIQQNGNYEVGTGTYLASGHRFSRSPQVSSAGGSTIDLQPGAVLVFTARADDFAIPGTPGLKGLQGDPGGNVMAIASFDTIASTNIPIGTNLVRTGEYRTGSLKGGAFYIADPAVNPTFVTAHPGWSFMSANGRGFRLSEGQTITDDMFGTYGDAATDDYPQWLFIKDFLQTYAVVHGNSYFKSIPIIHFGRYVYRLSHYLDLTDGIYVLLGAGPTAVDRGGNTFFQPDPGTSGIVLQSWDTAGISGTTTNTPKGSAGSRICDITIYGQGGTVGSPNEIGVLIKAPAFLERVNVYNMGGHGVFVAADVTHAGNANCGKMIDCVFSYNGLSGVRFEGGDSNAWDIQGCNAINNIQWGFHDLSFLGNHFAPGYHTSGNGNFSAGPSWAPGGARKTAQVTYSGHYYRVIPGQETWCSTNAPSGTTAHNTGWYYTGDGSANSVYPAWVSGIATTQGGAFCVTGASNKTVVGGGYMEGDQSPGWCDAQRATITAGGFSGWHQPVGLGNVIGANDGRIVIQRLGTAGNNGDGIELFPDQVQFGPNCYFQRTSVETFDLRGPLGGSLSMQRNGSGHQHPYSISFSAGIVIGAGNSGFLDTGSAVPSSGTWSQGAWRRNTAAAAGGVPGWVCTTGGVAGSTAVFKAMANLAA